LAVGGAGGLPSLIARLSVVLVESGSELTLPERARILTQLVVVASLDDRLHPMEIAILRGVAASLELPPSLLDVVIEQLRAGENPFI
jgi:hypothetical protein